MVCSTIDVRGVWRDGVRTVCVTGVTGFICSHILPLLLRLGVNIRALTRSAQTDLGDMDSVVGDLFDTPRLGHFMQGAKRRVHLVCVQEVAVAVVFLPFFSRSLAGNVFLISADNEPANTYKATDAILGVVLGRPLFLSSAGMPSLLYTHLLRIAGRSQVAPQLITTRSKYALEASSPEAILHWRSKNSLSSI